MPADTTKLKEVQDLFLTQARYCEELDSPFMVRLCRLFAQHLDDEAGVARKLLDLPRPESFWNTALPLRVAGALHALVLTHQCAALARVYPPHHEEVPDSELWRALQHALQNHADFFVPFLDSVPQTNEVRRSGVLLPGFLTIAEATGLPFTVSELGASAGINLCWDAFFYRLGEESWGNPDSKVTMTPQWRGQPPPLSQDIRVVERAACDLNPIDMHNPAERLKLLAYIWADQQDRFVRTENALQILASKQYVVNRADISHWLPERLGRDTSGTVHVIYHTIAWNYQDKETRNRNQALIEAAGSRATVDNPLAWLRLEADDKDPGAALTLTLWPDGEGHTLGRADYHRHWSD